RARSRRPAPCKHDAKPARPIETRPRFGYFVIVTKRVLTLVACVAALALPQVNAWAAFKAKTSKTVTKLVFGTQVQCPPVGQKNYGKWGPLKLELKISKVPGSTKFRIVDVTWPVWPQHTVRSSFINSKALPLLRTEVLQMQTAFKVTSDTLVSGATNI